MGRERKPQVGSSNFNATTAASLETPMNSSRGAVKLTLLKPLSHKLITHPGEDDGSVPIRESQKSPTVWKSRGIDTLSVWRSSNVFKRDYSSETKEQFGDPINRHGKNDEGPFQEAVPEEVKQKMRADAVKRLANVANERFGNTINMMKAFKKQSGDAITFYEFHENLRQRGLDNAFPESDLNLVFEEFDKKNEGLVPVNALLQKTGPVEIEDKEEKDEMLQIRDFLAQQLERQKKAKEVSSVTDASQSSNKSSKQKQGGGSLGSGRQLGVVVDEKEEMKKALGQKTFDLDVNTEDLNEVINNVFHKHHTIESHNKFARFLRLTNVNIDRIPFYPMREDELQRLKQAAGRLEATASDPKFVDRYQTLVNRCRERLEQPVFGASISESNLAIVSTNNSSQVLLPPSDESQKLSLPGLDGPAVASPKSLFSPPRSLSPEKDNSSVYFLDRNESSPTDFTVAVSATKAMQNKGSGIFDFATNSNRQYNDFAGTRSSSTDLSRLGLTMAGDADDGTLDRQMSVSSSYFAPLNYVPSKEVTRDVISDAERAYLSKESRRKKRAERTAYNRQATTDRLEFDVLNKQLRELRRAQYRNEDTIRYQTAIFLNDMKSFKKIPLELMAKKPNFRRSDRMFGGSLRNTDVKDDRDFASTYKSDYNEAAVKATRTLGEAPPHGPFGH